MADQSELLSRTKPLADPVRVITILSLVGAFLIAIVYALVSVPRQGLFGLFMALSLASGALSCAILVGPWGRPNAIYLRAFRTDRSTAKLRAELAAILGPGFRLTGIRPPRKKSSVFMRFWLPGLVALRYAGSEFMELEAGDDWMARLWKTYQTTRLVFIDAREVTRHVRLEIEMTLQTMGPERCVFVIGPGQDGQSNIAGLTGLENYASQVKVLVASEEQVRSRQLETDLKGILKGLSAVHPSDTGRGRQFILEHVSAEDLERSRRISVMTVVSAMMALAISLSLGFLPRSLQPFVLLPLAIVSLVVVTGAVFRTMGRIRRLARFGHRGAAVKASLLLALAALPFLSSVLIATVGIRELRAMKGRANELSAIMSLRTVYQAEIIYDTTYPDKGYACNLQALGGDPQNGSPSPEAAQIIPPDQTSGKRYGFAFTISGCTIVKIQGREKVTGFQLTAVPLDRKEAHRGFCMDETGEIRVDRNGGTHCTEALPPK